MIHSPAVLPNSRPFAALLTLIALSILARPATAQYQPDTTDARVTLSWNAPPGQPRSSATLEKACGDTSAVDTLYLCLIPGRDSPTLNGFSADLRIHPAEGDTLDVFWSAATSRGDSRRFSVIYAPDSMAGAASPFMVSGYGHTFTTITPTELRLRLLFAVPGTAAAPIVAGRTYVLAQVVMHRPPRRGAACSRPLCIEWAAGTLGLVMGYEPTVERGERYVGVRASVEQACARWNRGVGAKPWTPAPRQP